MAKERRIISSRIGRLGQLGLLAGGLASGAFSEGARQLARGRRPSLGDLLLTPANAQRLAQRLSQMRGAAMKLGQLMSLDGGQLLPKQLTDILAQLRHDAHAMPLGQVAAELRQAWGEGWQESFASFAFTPVAAASIGQVHEARLSDGRHLAIKIQYPGISRSIDSDVDNVASLLRMSGLVPENMDLDVLLDEAKKQLHSEADYTIEAAYLNRFAALLGDDPRYRVPQVHADYSCGSVLSMDFVQGVTIEEIGEHPRNVRERVATDLLELAFREVFEWGLVQTDPNFSNYLYDIHQRRIQLLDFGATRSYDATCRRELQRLLLASVDGMGDDIAAAARAVGYLGDDDPRDYRDSVVSLLRMVSEPLRQAEAYDFSHSELPQRMTDLVVDMRLRNRHGRLPPTSILFLHRKLAGLYLLLAQLRVKTVLRDHLSHFLAGSDDQPGGLALRNTA